MAAAARRFPLSRRARIVAAVGSGFVVAIVLLVHICADGGAMGAAYRTCRCRGIEWQLYDRTTVDGPRRTACFGWVSERTCFQSRDGTEVPCNE